ncbi:hypothetical protein EJB05_37025, partial [Eragrostis curvula]
MAPLDLDFRPGFGVQAVIRNKFGLPVNFSSGSGHKIFFLVVCFERCNFRLDVSSFAKILQATLGGAAADFRPLQIDSTSFKFAVSSKLVGFHIYGLRSFVCKQYKLLFRLWNPSRRMVVLPASHAQTDPDWRIMGKKGKSRPMTYAEVARMNNPLTGANAIPIGSSTGSEATKQIGIGSVFDRLEFPRISNSLQTGPGFQGTQSKLAVDKECPPVSSNGAGILNFKQKSTLHSFSTGQNLEGPSILICQRCLRSGHQKAKCRGRIRCRLCSQKGHIAYFCNSPPDRSGFAPKVQTTDCFLKNFDPGWGADWFKKTPSMTNGASASGPPKFFHLVELPWVQKEKEGQESRLLASPDLVHTDLCLGSQGHKAAEQNAAQPSVAPPSTPHNPSQLAATLEDPLREAMAFRRANPRPFMPPGFERIAVPARDVKVRACMARQQAQHEDFAIVTITPMPAGPVNFNNISEVIHDFLQQRMHVHVREVQPSCLGQALVRFEYFYDRDQLVQNSPYNQGGLTFTFKKHNEGRNWRKIEFNRECWLMLMGFPLDYWNSVCIQNALSSFARVISWDNDRRNLTRLIVKARVVDLPRVPQFIVLSEAEGFHGQSWMVQCEILRQQMLGADPADEDDDPDHDPQEDPFDFHGYGQEGPGNWQPDENDEEEPADNNDDQQDW